MNKYLWTLVAGVVLALAPDAHAQFSMNWYTIDGGGGTSSGGSFTIRGTIGQHDAGIMSGASLQLAGGFWGGATAPGCPADLDDGSGTGTPDGGVTIDDLVYFITAFNLGDIEADLDDDGLDPGNPDGGVTIDDLIFFLAHFAGGC
jgi:hypothetical protein